jgi:hypothetical protein
LFSVASEQQQQQKKNPRQPFLAGVEELVSTTATPGSSIPTLREGDIFMLPLG